MHVSHYLGDHVALTTTMFGDKIYVDTRDLSLAPHLLVAGDWEPWVTKAFRVMCTRLPGATVIDVGANFGWYTLIGNRCGAAAVVAIEPHPALFQLLRKTLIVNGYDKRTVAKQMACGAQAPGVIDHVYLEYSATELGGGKVSAERTGHGGRDADAYRVQSVALDEIVTAARLPPTGIIIKIDVEGGEVNVLKGATALLAHKPVLFVEHHRDNVAGLWHVLGDYNYTVKHVEHTGHIGAPLSEDAAQEIGDAETLLCEPRR